MEQFVGFGVYEVKVLEVKMSKPKISLLMYPYNKVNKLMQQHKSMLKPNYSSHMSYIEPQHLLMLRYKIPKVQPTTCLLADSPKLCVGIQNILLVLFGIFS